MRGRSLRHAALMIGGALVLVQIVVTVLESQARPAADPSFAIEMQQAQHSSAASRYATAPKK